MSVNYYAFGPFPGGEEAGDGLHIGQMRGGMRFLFHSVPALGLTTAAAWRAFLHQDATLIRDENHIEYTPDQMIEESTATHDSTGRLLRRRFDGPNYQELPNGFHLDRDGNHTFSSHNFH